MQKHPNLPDRDAVVVVVDDDLAVRSSLRFSLEIEGFTVRAFADGDALLRESNFLECGCLVIDQNLPGMNGLELIERLHERNISAPAILITTHPTRALKDRAAIAGITIIEKPLLGSVLLDEICHVMTLPAT